MTRGKGRKVDYRSLILIDPTEPHPSSIYKNMSKPNITFNMTKSLKVA